MHNISVHVTLSTLYPASVLDVKSSLGRLANEVVTSEYTL